jgi:hypothetical protein
VAEFQSCDPGPGFNFLVRTTGRLSNFQFTSAGRCAELRTVSGVGSGGRQNGVAKLTRCCPEPVRVAASGTAFSGSALEQAYSFTERSFGQLEATPENCVPDPPKDIHRLRFTAFIPANHVKAFLCGLAPPSHCLLGPPVPLPLVVEADDRDYSPDSRRARVGMEVQVDLNRATNPEARLSLRTWIEKTSVYTLGAILDDGRITPADRDETPLDCHLWHADYEATGGAYAPQAKWLDDDTIQFNISGSAGTGAAPFGLVPNFDWEFIVTLSADGSWSLRGKHNCYPAYELWLDGRQIYGFKPRGTPDGSDCLELGRCLVGLFGVEVSCNSGQPCAIDRR